MNDKLKKEIASQIVELRESRGFTQQDLAERINVSRSTVANWEQQRREVGADELLKIYDIFGVDTNEYINKLKKFLYK